MGPVYLFHGDVSPPRRRVTFATAQKSPKSRSGGGVFRFPPPPENPYPTPTNLVLVSSRSLVSPERARLAPSATRPLPMEIACAGFPLGSRFGPPLLDVPPGDGGRRRDDTGRKLYHPTPTAPRGSTRGGAFKRVAETALWFCRTVATGGRTARRQRPPRAGTVAPGFRTKLPRKRGPGADSPCQGEMAEGQRG